MTQTIDSQATTAEICAALSETAPQAMHQIAQVVDALGPEQARALLTETLHIEMSGGMLVNDQSRRRTPGGTFLHLAKGRLDPTIRDTIFPKDWKHKHYKLPGSTADAPSTPPAPPMEWSERMTLYEQIPNTEHGEAKTVKVTLIGRPGKVVERGDLVLTTMKSSKIPALPKGLPTPPAQPTTYALYMSAKHWRKVREALKNTEDVLIVEGFQAYDPNLKGITVWGTNVTTKILQQRDREAKQAK